jgi:hypothetical protein
MAETNAGNGLPVECNLSTIALLFSTIAAQRSIASPSITCHARKLHLHWPLPETIPSPTPPVGHIQCWQAEHPGSNSHLMCGDSWGSVVDVSEALEKKHQEFCKAIPNSNGAQVCNGATWHP